jgi:hypothetical protein
LLLEEYPWICVWLHAVFYDAFFVEWLVVCFRRTVTCSTTTTTTTTRLVELLTIT